MRDLRQYWQEVRTLERSLPEFIWLMSLADPKRGMVGGRMAQACATQAAQLLHAHCYRIATEEEIAEHLAKEEHSRRQSYQDGMRRRGVAVVAVPAVTTSKMAVEDGKRAGSKRQ
jgi:hypothetical protein